MEASETRTRILAGPTTAVCASCGAVEPVAAPALPGYLCAECEAEQE